MSYQDDRDNNLDAEIEKLLNVRRMQRQREKSLIGRSQYLAQPSQFQLNNVKSLKGQLNENFAPYMNPVNVGAINEVAWPFWFQVDLDFGTDPDIASNVFQKGFFQVDQESAAILMSVIVGYGTDAAGASALQYAPMQVEFIDRQSSRRFNTGPLPVQQLGENSNPAILPVGMLLMPNAFLDVVASGIPDISQPTTGSGILSFSFFCYRTRIENASKVLSTIFG